MICHGGLTTEGTPDPDTAAGDPETTRRNARADGTPQPQPLSPTSTPALPLPTFRANPFLYRGIRSLVPKGSRVGPLSDSVALPPLPTTVTLTLKLFQGERAISTFDDTFNPPHRSSPSFSTLVSGADKVILSTSRVCK
jgi:hypothetical protein